MKSIHIIILSILTSCATDRIVNCETEVIDGKLTTIIHVERSGRLHRQLTTDSLAHVLRMEKQRTRQLSDSLSFEKKKSKYDLRSQVSGLRTVLAMEKQRTKQLSDSLNEARRIHNSDEKTKRKGIATDGKKIKQSQKTVRRLFGWWYVLVYIAGIATVILGKFLCRKARDKLRWF